MIRKFLTRLRDKIFSPHGEFDDSEQAWLEAIGGSKPGTHNASKHLKPYTTRMLVKECARNGMKLSESKLKALGLKGRA